MHISDEAVEEILNWGGGPEPVTFAHTETWERFFKNWHNQLLMPTLSGKKSDKTYKCKYCGGTAYWMKTSKGYRLVDFLTRPINVRITNWAKFYESIYGSISLNPNNCYDI